MGRLTWDKENGEWGLKNGYDMKKVPKELYGALCKLHEYEKSGLEPEEVRKVNDFSESQAAVYLAKYQEYAKLGVTPEQLLQIDKMYADRCREIADLERRMKRK